MLLQFTATAKFSRYIEFTDHRLAADSNSTILINLYVFMYMVIKQIFFDSEFYGLKQCKECYGRKPFSKTIIFETITFIFTAPIDSRELIFYPE